MLTMRAKGARILALSTEVGILSLSTSLSSVHSIMHLPFEAS